MGDQIDNAAFDQIFTNGRTFSNFQSKEVPDRLLRDLVDAANLGPTSANCLPARLVFVRSPEARERLRPHLSEGNRDKTMAAPVCMIVGYDLKFYDHLPKLYPFADARSWFVGKPAHIESTAFRNSSLQGGYLILAARALGLDCGPMSGFDNAGVDAAFFAGTEIKSNFICNLGYGEPGSVKPRAPRLSFDEMATIV